MRAINTTLIFDGNAEAAFNFYKTVFGGEFLHLQRLKEIPGAPEMPEAEGNKVLHVALPVGGSVLMGMDMPAGRGTVNPGNNFMLTLDTESEEETRDVFNALANGGTVTMPLAKQFWSDYFGMVTDKFGIAWMLNFVQQQQG